MRTINTGNSNKLTGDIGMVERCISGAVAVLLILVIGSLMTNAQTAGGSGPKQFATADEAAEAIISAAEIFDEAALKEILGPGNYDIIHSGEPVQGRETAIAFGKLGRTKKTLVTDKSNPRLVMMSIGDDDWPFPLPIVKKGSTWFFDAVAGRQEILFRRIGRNELDAINVCEAFVEAQHEYASQKRDGAPVNQYAQRIISTAGKQDGLAWRNADGTPGGPVGEEIAAAIERGYTDKSAPFHGYHFRVLKGQGAAAPLGRLDYVVNGYMIGGFALIAYPSMHRVTGVKTFMVSNDGVIYEKDLGPNTAEVVKGIELFNPDATWRPVSN